MSHPTESDAPDPAHARASRVAASTLRDFAAAILGRAGMPDEDAGICADAMVWSDLRGRPAHGVAARLPQVLGRLREGTNPAPRWSIVQESAGIAVLDADGGWGQVAGSRAMRIAIARARETGIGATVVRRADIAAALGRYPAIAIEHRMIGLAINNTWPVMPVWGSRAGLLGNQAFAIGAPAGRHSPILFDSAVSAMSKRQVEAVRDSGEQLPPGVALDRDGAATVDPVAALDGVLLPMAGHRGSGLALMWEVLTGVLAGARMAPDVGGTPLGISMFCLAIDPAALMPYDDFVARIDRLIDAALASPPASDVDQVRVPGQRGYQLAAEYERDGVSITPEQDSTLRGLGQEHGMPWPG
jgi:LDH2 family malate/lactate/ureidoglycolate dehydrogenase